MSKCLCKIAISRAVKPALSFLVDLGTVLEKPLHFIHIAGLARHMECPLVTLVLFIITDLLVFEKSDNTCSPFRVRIAKESGHDHA